MKEICFFAFTIFAMYPAAVTPSSISAPNQTLPIEECLDDSNCYKGNYCSDGICLHCVNCTYYHRDGYDCSFNFSQCGGCLWGYEEIKTNHQKRSKACRKVNLVNIKPECRDDQDCGNNYYCQDKLCVKCFDCNIINREQKNKCSKTRRDCGSCIDGYAELGKTSKFKPHPCRKEKKSQFEAVILQDNRGDVGRNVNVGRFSALSLTLSAAVVFFAVIFIYGKKPPAIRTRRSEEEASPSNFPPPRYGSESFETSDEITDVVTFAESKENSNMAVLYKPPNAPYYPSPLPQQDVTEADDVDQPEYDFVNGDDEATVPSTWSPDPPSPATEGEESLSFAGIGGLINQPGTSSSLTNAEAAINLAGIKTEEEEEEEEENPLNEQNEQFGIISTNQFQEN